MRYPLICLTTGSLLLVTACTKTEDVTPAVMTGRDNNLALGNPSGAVASTSSPTNYLLVRDQYTLSYNRDQGKPNWVIWHLSSAWLGSASRQDNFTADPDLPSGWHQVKATDYVGSGFDRGKMVCLSCTELKYGFTRNFKVAPAPKGAL